jgi:hypothetical protein
MGLLVHMGLQSSSYCQQLTPTAPCAGPGFFPFGNAGGGGVVHACPFCGKGFAALDDLEVGVVSWYSCGTGSYGPGWRDSTVSCCTPPAACHPVLEVTVAVDAAAVLL